MQSHSIKPAEVMNAYQNFDGPRHAPKAERVQTAPKAEPAALSPKRTKITSAAADLMGVSVSISRQSLDFIAGAAKRKTQQAALIAASRQSSVNSFVGSGGDRHQYQVLSEGLADSGYYEPMDAPQALQTDLLLRDITSGMTDYAKQAPSDVNDISNEAAKIELESSVRALNVFAERLPEQSREAFQKLIDEYQTYNARRVQNGGNVDFEFNEEILPSAEDFDFTGESISRYHELFNELVSGAGSVREVFANLQRALVSYSSGAGTLPRPDLRSMGRMSGYWNKLLK